MSSIYGLLKRTIDKLAAEIVKVYTYVDNKVANIQGAEVVNDTAPAADKTYSSLKIDQEITNLNEEIAQKDSDLAKLESEVKKIKRFNLIGV